KLTVEQRRRVPEPDRYRRQHPVPLVVGEPPHPDAHLVRRGLPALDLGPRLTRRQQKLADRTAARVVATTRQPVGIEPRPLLQRLQPRPPPPGPAELHRAHTPPPRSSTSEASSASDSSAIQPSPEPTTASASSRLVSSSAAMRSSSVPSAMRRCT